MDVPGRASKKYCILICYIDFLWINVAFLLCIVICTCDSVIPAIHTKTGHYSNQSITESTGQGNRGGRSPYRPKDVYIP